ncbi:hypothetical protein EDC04DRAFT_164608 [Pisolithus marmoratus]|nr:hypothetical protein EDC04DRAFT_164608 [Pisolithus marmoratus]
MIAPVIDVSVEGDLWVHCFIWFLIVRITGTFRKTMLDGDSHRAALLYCLACDLQMSFTEKAAVCDLEEAIELHRAALELRPSGTLYRYLSLHQLALCLLDRYDCQGVVNDLEEAIKFGRAELELCLPGHAQRGTSLHTLACFLRKRFVKRAAIHDLEEAIELHHAALELRPSEDPDRISTLRICSLSGE